MLRALLKLLADIVTTRPDEDTRSSKHDSKAAYTCGEELDVLELSLYNSWMVEVGSLDER